MCDAPNPGVFFFFWSQYKSVATENPCRAPTSCRDNPGRARSALLSAHPERCRRVYPSPVVPTLSRPGCAMSRHELHVKTKLSHDLEYQVATWEPPPMTKLCRNNEPFYKSVATENPCRAPTSCCDNPGRARSALSSAHPERYRRVCPSPVVPTLSQPGFAMSQHELHVKTQTQSRPRILGRDMGTSSHDQALSQQ